MRWVICFDVANNKRRRQLVQALLAVGYRVQESVFEADLETCELDRLLGSLGASFSAEADSLRAYALGVPGPPLLRLLGVARPVETAQYAII